MQKHGKLDSEDISLITYSKKIDFKLSGYSLNNF